MSADNETVETKPLVNCSLADAISQTFDKASATAMLMSPKRYVFATLKDGFLYGRDGEVSLDDLYEAHIFNADMTVHWHRLSGAQGGAVLHVVKSTKGGTAEDKAQFSVDIPHLIWGKPSGPPKGDWTRLTAARIGGLDVPVKVEEGQRVRLLSKAWFEPVSKACGNPEMLGITYSKLEAVDWPSVKPSSQEG